MYIISTRFFDLMPAAFVEAEQTFLSATSFRKSPRMEIERERIDPEGRLRELCDVNGIRSLYYKSHPARN